MKKIDWFQVFTKLIEILIIGFLTVVSYFTFAFFSILYFLTLDKYMLLFLTWNLLISISLSYEYIKVNSGRPLEKNKNGR